MSLSVTVSSEDADGAPLHWILHHHGSAGKSTMVSRTIFQKIYFFKKKLISVFPTYFAHTPGTRSTR